MNREELKKIIRGAIVTMPTPFDDDFNVDIARMSDITKWWVEQGLGTSKAPLKVAAAMGEGPDLSDDEWPHLLRTVVNAAPGKNVICAIQVKNTLATIEDAKKAQDLGAVGLQIDLPFLHHSNQDDLVSIVSSLNNYGSVYPGEISFGNNSYVIELNTSFTQIDDLDLRLSISDGENEWSSLINLNLNAGFLVFDSFELINGSELSPGEDAYLKVYLKKRNMFRKTN